MDTQDDQIVAKGASNATSKTRIVCDSSRPLPADAQVALVTGAAGAIGQAICHRLSRIGFVVIALDVDVERVRQLAETLQQQYDRTALAIYADISDRAAPAELMNIVAQRIGRLDHLINNAGLNRPASIHDVSLEDWENVLAVNLRAPVFLCQAAIPFWLRQGGGSIVNIGSRVWLSGSVPAYTASKAGLVGLTRSLAVELGPLNVTANVVAPSFIDTAFTRQNRTSDQIAQMHDRVRQITPIPRLGLAEDIANAVSFLVSPEARFITGEVLHVCGGAQLASRVVAPSVAVAPQV